MYELTELLNNPEDHYPGNFDTPQRANALLTGLCQDAAKEIAKLQAEVERLKASIALDKMAEDARTIGLRLDDWDKIGCVNHDCDKCKAVQEPVAVVSGYYGGQCVVLPTNPARLFNSGTAFYTAPEKGNTP
jgi:uncharacterized small protein (DUF1192 family)